ncbi:peptidoglycan-binding domain-containing protein, partial [Marinococcus luteus]|uniref:peptidoglycan-binding domain-containing protein n=1 Tax=Marinococcus luteus TaxID=1122204 RepID=UPI002ACD1127
MFSFKKIIFFSSFIVSVSLCTFTDTAHANEKDDSKELNITEGTEASEVKELEEALIILGYPLEEADTLFDSITSIHVSDYQEQNNFEVTGEVDQELLDNILKDIKIIEESEVESESSNTSVGIEEAGTDSSPNQKDDEDSSNELQKEEPQETDSDDTENEQAESEPQHSETEEKSADEEKQSAETEEAFEDVEDEETTQTSDSDGQDSEQEESDEEKNTAEEPQNIEVEEKEPVTQEMKIDDDQETAEDESSKEAKADDEASIEQKEAASQKARSFVLATNTFSTSTVSNSTLLKDGVTSPAAQTMKTDLYELGYLDIAEPNDHFGPKTETAVQAFQRDHDLYVDGVAGPNTLAKLGEVMQNP